MGVWGRSPQGFGSCSKGIACQGGTEWLPSDWWKTTCTNESSLA